MKQYCEYCGSVAPISFNICKSCGAPFTINTKTRDESFIISNISNYAQLYSNLIPVFVLFAPILYIYNMLKDRVI